MKLFNFYCSLIIIMLILQGCVSRIDSPQTDNITSEFEYPIEGMQISEPIRIKVDVSPQSENYKVKFLLNQSLVYTDSSLPYEFYWDVGQWKGENVKLTSQVFNSNNKVSEKSINVFVTPFAENGVKNLCPSNNSILDSPNLLMLNWTKPNNTNEYQIRLSVDESFGTLYRQLITSNNGVYLQFLKYGKYYWQVRTKGLHGTWGEWNNPSNFSYLYTNGGFESGDFTGWSLEEADENSIRIVHEDPYQGNYCAKTILNPGDEVNNGHRVELVRYDFDVYGDIRVYEFSYKFDVNFIDDPQWRIIQQFHDMPDFPHGETWENYAVKPPPIFIRYKQDTCCVMNSTIQDTTEVCRFTIEKDKWFRIQFVIKWSMYHDGFIECFMNGNPITPWNGTNYNYYSPTVYNEVGNYFKIGQYSNAPTFNTTVTYVDAIKIGSL